MVLRRALSFAALALCCAPLLLPIFTAPAHAAGSLYCCNESSGKQICSDLLPPECYGRAYRELGETGRTLRTVEAPLTAEQRAQRAAAEAQRKAEEAVQREKQRKDQALLNTYSSEKDIELMRTRAIEDVQKSIRAAETTIAEVRLRRKSFENEAEFYKKRTLPPDVQKGLRDADRDIAAQEGLIESKGKDLEAIKLKYDEDRRRYIEISQRTVVR
jgi:septal ring factor EnvC (AmiA/AmiB activator)